jgi:transposase-like protein
MSYATAELLGCVERRRRFSVEQKLAVLSEATAPGANISAVVRRHGLLPVQVYKWRRLAELGIIGVPGASELSSFVAVEITKDVPSLPARVLEDKRAAADCPPRRRQRNGVYCRDQSRATLGATRSIMQHDPIGPLLYRGCHHHQRAPVKGPTHSGTCARLHVIVGKRYR